MCHQQGQRIQEHWSNLRDRKSSLDGQRLPWPARRKSPPDEDRSAIAARAEAWNTFYQPESPAAHHLVNECVRATAHGRLLQPLSHRRVVAAQISEVPLRWETSRQDKLDRLAAKFRSCPVKTVRKLGRTARGCRWMIERWTVLADAFKTNPGWTDSQLDDAMRLLGYAPNSWRIEPEVYTLNLFNVLCYGVAMPTSFQDS